MKNRLNFLFMMLLTAATSSFAEIRTVASSSDIAAIVREIGGEDIDAATIAKGKANLHFVEVLPSYMLKVSKADIYFKIGLAMDQWADDIIAGSRNGKLLVVDCSTGIEVLERPTGKVNASMGDVHAEGNPHYWLDPRNGKVIARNILDGLSQVDPGNRSKYEANFDSLVRRLDSAWEAWSARAASVKAKAIISYHSSWAYFARAFDVRIAGFIEPKPGIEPTASHTAELIGIMKAQGVKLVFREPYFSDRSPSVLAKATGATVITVPSSVGGTEQATDYFTLFDDLIDALAKGTGSRD